MIDPDEQPNLPYHPVPDPLKWTAAPRIRIPRSRRLSNSAAIMGKVAIAIAKEPLLTR
jgi:hypothetical protein